VAQDGAGADARDAAAAAVAVDPGAAALELALPPDAAERPHQLPPLARLGAGAGRKVECELIWHDTPAGALAEAGLCLCERRAGRQRSWRLERLFGTREAPWPPGAPPPLLAEAPALADLADAMPGGAPPSPLLPVAAWSGTLRALPLARGDVSVTLARGDIRAVAGERPAARLLLRGPPEALAALAMALAEAAPVSVPPVPLAAEAFAVAGRPVPPPALGAPELPEGLSVAGAFAAIVGHLTLVLLHWAPLAAGGIAPEPVHQMRVALRRLRSALKLFKAATGGDAVDSAEAELRALSRVLGPARDWDVFGAGTAKAVAELFAEERAVARLVAAAERQRLASYSALAAHVNGPAFRLLGARLACLGALRAWERPPADASAEAAGTRAALLASPLAGFAGRALAHRLGKLRPPPGNFRDAPAQALHELRIEAKRLRYAAEFFEPLFPRKETRRFLRRIAALQERLGHLNDGAVAATLMSALGGGGPERAMAVGIVRGFVAASAGDARASSERAWRKLRRLEAFWE